MGDYADYEIEKEESGGDYDEFKKFKKDRRRSNTEWSAQN